MTKIKKEAGLEMAHIIIWEQQGRGMTPYRCILVEVAGEPE